MAFFCRIVILFVSDFGAHPKMFAQYKRCEWKIAVEVDKAVVFKYRGGRFYSDMLIKMKINFFFISNLKDGG